MAISSWAATHVGAVRKHNEDNFVNRTDLGVWAVADGAGGHQSGEIASAAIAEALNDLPPSLSAGEVLAEVRLRLESVHQSLSAEAARLGAQTMIVSTVVVLIIRDDYFACLWAGDSRAYLLRDGELQQITRDHSLVQQLVEAGAVRPEDAEQHPQANVITRAVGVIGEALELEKVSGPLYPGDRFLLCSDGLSKTLTEQEVSSLLSAPAGVAIPDAMVAATLERRGRDNVTAVVVGY